MAVRRVPAALETPRRKQRLAEPAPPPLEGLRQGRLHNTEARLVHAALHPRQKLADKHILSPGGLGGHECVAQRGQGRLRRSGDIGELVVVRQLLVHAVKNAGWY